MNFINANSNRRIEKHMHLSRSSFMKLLSASLLTMALWINACNFGNAGPEPTAKPEKEINMENLKSSSNPKTTIPPLDAALPARIETATFALG
jgi:hypothetical protein